MSLVSESKVAIDCGCGVGSDIDYVAESGLTVYGFDIERESVSCCRSRLKEISNVIISQPSFSTFNYPKASIIMADASLYFCPLSELESVWDKIYRPLHSSGVFCGPILGQ